MRLFSLIPVLFFLFFSLNSCREKEAGSKPVEDPVFVHDTVFVSIDVNAKNADSLETVYGPFLNEANRSLVEQGEKVSGTIRLSIPLLPKNWVNDYDDLFTREQEAALNSSISGYEEKLTVEIGVVTLDSSWTTHDGVDAFLLKLHNAWGIGKRGKNNGILIGISQGHRTVRVSNGEGIGERLTDSKTDSIVKNAMLPEYANGNYYEGTRKGIELMIRELEKANVEQDDGNN
jgi:uncharacterized protein